MSLYTQLKYFVMHLINFLSFSCSTHNNIKSSPNIGSLSSMGVLNVGTRFHHTMVAASGILKISSIPYARFLLWIWVCTATNDSA